MRFQIIDPKARTVTPFEAHDAGEAYRAAGLDPGAVDHGVVLPGLGIVVYEYGLFDDPDKQTYFALGHGAVCSRAERNRGKAPHVPGRW